MKKFILIFISLLFISINSYSQSNFFDRNTEVEFGFNIGAIHNLTYKEYEHPYNCEKNTYYIFTGSFYGFYFDFGFSGRYIQESRVSEWPETKGYSFHTGYKLPITDYLIIIPLIGYINESQCTYESCYYDYYAYCNGLRRDYCEHTKFHDIDYGGKLQISIPLSNTDNYLFKPRLNLDGAFTKNMYYFGLAFQFNF